MTDSNQAVKSANETVLTAADDAKHIHRAYELAKQSYDAGGCPIGAVLVDAGTGAVLGEGHNCLVQEGNPILHGEMSALRAAGRMASRRNTVMYTSLTPCMMCTGTMLQFKVGRVVIGDATNSDPTANVELLTSRGVAVAVLEHKECVALVRRFIEEKPHLWLEDWGGP